MKVLSFILLVALALAVKSPKPNRATDLSNTNEFYIGLLESLVKWAPNGSPSCK